MKRSPFGLWPVAALFVLTLGCTAARANDIYIAQTAAGANTGQSCANAFAYTFFNTASNWGTGAGQIGPGTTVHLCGRIANALTAQGSGSSGSPVTILFDSVSKGQISMAALPATGGLVLDGQSYITVDGNNSIGVIQSANNGSPSSLCSGSTYSSDIISKGISAASTRNIEIKNLTIGPVYVHVCTADDSANHSALSPPGPVCISFSGTQGMTIDGNTMHDAAWCLNGGGNNISIHHNAIYNIDHGLGMGIAAASATMTGLYFYNNSVRDATIWDTDDNSFHHDGVHLFAYCSNGSSLCSGSYITSVYIYNNHVYGSWLANTTGALFFEGNIRSAYVFNNYLDGSRFINRFYLLPLEGTNVAVYNNTAVGYSTADSDPSLFLLGGLGSVTENNIFSTANSVIGTGASFFGTPFTVALLAHNIYANGGGNAFVWCPRSGGSCSFLGSGQFSVWESDSGETGSSYSSSAGLNANGTLTPGSPAIAAGVNLYSTCNGQPNPGLGALCYDAAGNPRPASGPWDAGAYNLSSGSVPSPPSSLTTVTH